MPPPVRQHAGDYHFHVYDYANSAPPNGPGPWGLSPAQNNLQFYSLVQDLQGLVQEGQNRGVPNIAVTDAGAQIAGNMHTKVLSFGNLGNAHNAPTVIFTGGIHAREWIAPEMAYLLAEYLVVNYHANPQSNHALRIKALVDACSIHIIPMLNPAGNHHTVFGVANTDGVVPRRWRKNRRPLPATADAWVTALTQQHPCNPPFQNVKKTGGSAEYDVPDYAAGVGIPHPPQYQTRNLLINKTGVDLNRNCPTPAWGYECKPNDNMHANSNPRTETYFGPAGGSETETANIRQFLQNNPPAILIDYHSSGQVILYPSEVSNTNAVNQDYQSVGQTLQALIQSGNGEGYELKSVYQAFGYDGTGGLSDYAGMTHQTHAFAIELDPKQGGGLTPAENEICEVFEKNIRGALAVLAVPTALTYQGLVQEFLGWNVHGRGNQLPL